MGVIEDGTAAGVLPETEAFAVHYPGYPSSTDRAIETLGGMAEITKRRNSKDRYIELRFRPEDPFSHQTFGDLRSSNTLLLKISKKKLSSGGGNSEPCEVSQEQVNPLQSSGQLCADVVARVRQAYQFNGMADYQYVLPVHAAKMKKKIRHLSDIHDMQANIENSGFVDLENEDLMMLVPPLFSPKDIPEEIVLKPSSSLISKQLQKGVVEQRWELDIEPCLALPFTIEKVPDKICWENNIRKGSPEWECQMAVSKLFDERPVWPRQSLFERLLDDGQQATDHLLRRLLYRSGYYFSTGPFGKFWIRKGYDPRHDSESQIYQKIDFRVPGPVRKFANTSSNKSSKPRWRDVCRFQAFPSKAFTCLQFFELEDDYIQQEIRKPAQKKHCTHSTGWLSSIMLEILRLHVKIRFLAMFDNGISENLVKSSKKQLEKAKKTLLYGESYHEWEEEVDPHYNKEHKSHVSESPLRKHRTLHPVRDTEEEPDDYVIEDEEDEEEELDEYESSFMGGGIETSPLDKHQHGTGESTSNYLQEILSGFHSNDTANYDYNGGLIAAASSDGEYQIYEQGSDDDDDDGDNYL